MSTSTAAPLELRPDPGQTAEGRPGASETGLRARLRRLDRRSLPAFACLVVGGIAIVVYARLHDGEGRALAYEAVALGSLIAMTLGIVMMKPRPASGWWLLLAGQAFFFGGDVTWNVYQYQLHVQLPSPSIADGLYLLGYPCLVLGLWRLLRLRAGRLEAGGWFDAGIVLAGSAVVVWIFVVDRYEDRLLHSAAAMIAVAYPAFDLLIIAVLARIVFAPGRRGVAFGLLVSSVLALLLADIGYAVIVANDAYEHGSWVWLGWLGSYVLLASATLHPSMRTVAESVSDPEALSRRRVRLLGAVTLLPLASFFAAKAVHLSVDPTAPVIGGSLLFVLVMGRMAGLVRQVEGKAQELQLQERERTKLHEKMNRAVEQERLRFAAELHDGPIQHLARIGYGLGRTSLRLDRGDVDGSRELLETAEANLSEEIRELRRVMSDLSPPILSQRGLVAALMDHAKQVSERHELSCELEAELDERLDPDLETALFRATQGALTNVVKHAAASRVSIRLARTNGVVHLVIRDDGTGFDPRVAAEAGGESHFGLIAMRERISMTGGELEVRSSPGFGTTVLVAVPVGGSSDPGAERAR